MVPLRLQQEWDAWRWAAWEPVSLVDAFWGPVNPSLDLQVLFLQFKDRFFWRHLEAMEVKCAHQPRDRRHITVYHTFHDEVGEHPGHWWRCNGPCCTNSPTLWLCEACYQQGTLCP